MRGRERRWPLELYRATTRTITINGGDMSWER